mgnify:CR=1 FL=1|tara:strand:+ start:121 stop:567 length:447 start_codon:yes stop_codon:yes gene_type:complete
MASKFIIELMKKGAQKLAGQSKTTGKEGIKFIKPDIGKLKKTQDAKKKITDITDKYAVGFAKDDPKLLKKFRKNSKKNLDSISKIYEGKKDGGRMGRKFGSKPKTNVQKIKETFAPKKPENVPSKFKGFSKLPEAVQQKINKKLAKKV